MRLTLGEATFNVSFGDDYDEDPYGDGTPGFGGTFDVNLKQYADLWTEWQWQFYSIDEDTAKWDAEEHDEDEQISIPNGDDFIAFFNAAMLDGGEWDICFNGSPYWFFHDVNHAQKDCQGGSVQIDADGYAEDRALFEGAKLAHENGIGLGVIFKQLAAVLGPFEQRFKRPTDALDRFAESLDTVAQ